ncbi:probable translation initiation factor eIF-2B subunit delta isoform X2 [Coffea eugenioides]|uniref:probable translation initiation factor eIF-2B subunit delta isoform X2 n=1 Tax=Coffea eugenioides TaxID=49369 RepID=UPI000F611A0D|nr:probable translation initiation factor eIF-2B subunit delta isoform X2 [Coffea eugenioides]
MDPRRYSRVIDPKVRQVGFCPRSGQVQNQSGPTGPSTSPPVSDISPSSNSLSPVMIPPPRHPSDAASRAVNVPAAATTPLRPRRPSFDDPNNNSSSTEQLVVSSYNPDESVLGTSPPFSGIGDDRDGDAESEFSDNSVNWIRQNDSGRFPLSLAPDGRFDSAAAKEKQSKKPQVGSRKERGGGQTAEVRNDLPSESKPLKEKTSKAARRALQEAQRAVKAAAKAGGNKSKAASLSAHEQTDKAVKLPLQRKDDGPVTSSAAVSERRGGERPPEKDRKKDAPAPRMQFDDKNRVEKAKKRSVVKQTEARNRVELFRHLPQYEHGTQLPDLESKFFQLDPMHPSIYKVGLQYLAGDIRGGNARCVAMLQAFSEAIKDYSTPPEKTLTRDLTAKVNNFVSFLIECRPLSISMGNAIRFLKSRIAKLPITLSEAEAKSSLCSDIERFINEKIVIAEKVIVEHAVTKIQDGDVLLTYGSSAVVEMVILHAHKLGKQFRVVIVDSRPRFEGQALLRKLVKIGVSCTYTHINAVSYIMREVTRVFLGAASVFSNGTVYSRVGTACVAMVAHAFHVPVLVCCEAYKFHERVLLDSICSNELGDPDAISKVPGRMDINSLHDGTNKENLQHLNLMYDATPPDYISMIVTEYGMIPTTSVPVIVREYGREHLLI